MAELSDDSVSNNINDVTNDNIIDNIVGNDNISDNKIVTLNNCDEREAVRRQFYRKRIKRSNIRLETDDSLQEKRRKILLEYQKKYV